MSVPEKLHSSLQGRYQPLPKTDGSTPQRARAATIRYRERRAKEAAKVRDGYRCRWPGCVVRGKGYVESMHVVDKQMGGDHGEHSFETADYVTGCPRHHRLLTEQRASMHVGPDGGDGPVTFVQGGQVVR